MERKEGLRQPNEKNPLQGPEGKEGTEWVVVFSLAPVMRSACLLPRVEQKYTTRCLG